MTETNGVAETNANGNGLMQTNGVAEPKANGNGSNNVAENTNGNGLSGRCPSLAGEVSLSPSTKTTNLPSWVDESCNGKGSPNGLVLPILAVIGALAIMFVGFSSWGDPPTCRGAASMVSGSLARRVGHSVLLPSTTPLWVPAPPVLLLLKPQ